MEPGVHAGVAEALDAQHGLLGGAEHGEGFIVELALEIIFHFHTCHCLKIIFLILHLLFGEAL